jgi:hypothetical protein
MGRATRKPDGGNDAPAPPRPLPDNVVDLRSRLTAVRSGSLPDDAA